VNLPSTELEHGGADVRLLRWITRYRFTDLLSPANAARFS
jgi:hypothetical protein